jgi:protein-S-isoprenylcysteine O-methyltransferase Ste14
VSRVSAIDRVLGPDKNWALGQLALIGAIFAGGLLEYRRYGRGFDLGFRPLSYVVGCVLLAIAAVVAVRAKADLGRSFTMSPTPALDGALVETGVYGVVRHPMYLSVVTMVLGVAVMLGSWVTLAGTLVVLVFFQLKAAREERLLVRRYPEYTRYRQRVRGRILPRIR